MAPENPKSDVRVGSLAVKLILSKSRRLNLWNRTDGELSQRAVNLLHRVEAKAQYSLGDT